MDFLDALEFRMVAKNSVWGRMMWTEDELLGFCEKLIAKRKYIIAEEILWEAAKKNRLSPVAPALLGRIFEETK
jgi:hypothetical protein